MRLLLLLALGALQGCVPPGSDDDKEGEADTDTDTDTDIDTDLPAEDADRDGYPADEDCNDADPLIHPGAAEVCDPGDVDENCNGNADNADRTLTGGTVAFHDVDGDGYGDASDSVALCEVGGGYVFDDTDCDDNDPDVHPERDEACDAADVDENCDGLADNADPTATGAATWYADTDGDGYGDDTSTRPACDAEAGIAPVGGDCDDTAATVSPAAAEVCNNGADDDCDGTMNDCRIDAASATSADVELVGEDDEDNAGTGVAIADVDGDGLGDLLVGASDEDGGSTSSGTTYGAVYVVASVSSASIDLSAATKKWTGTDANGELGRSVASAGDTNGDGYEDWIVGAPSYSTTGWAGIYLGGSTLPASATTTMSGLGDRCGTAVDGGVDVDGDGLDDAVAGCQGVYSSASSGAYVATASGTHSITTTSVSTRYAGGSVALLDLSGDGTGDVLVGDYPAATVYLFEGPITADLSATDADDTFVGSSGAGFRLAAIGDADGDGAEDLALSEYNDTWVVPGGSSGALSSGAAFEVGSVCEVAALAGGDLDGDGTSDLVVGCHASDDFGSVSILYGPLAAGMDLGTDATTVTGDEYGGRFGASVATGDVDGDGFDDLHVGAPLESSGGGQSGSTFLFYGGGL